MSSSRAVIFDLDGTLLNTLASLASCYNRVLSANGFAEHETKSYRHFIGNGAKACLKACLSSSGELEGLSESRIEELLAAQQVDYLENWHNQVVIYPGIDELIKSLQKIKIPLGVLTNKDHRFAVRCVEHFFPTQPFDSIQGYSEAVPHKPDPTGARALISSLGKEPNQTFLIGDSAVDINTATAAGIQSIGVLWGFRDKEELESADADWVIANPSEVLACLNRA